MTLSERRAVGRVLRLDPSGHFAKLDARTRASYLRALRDFARRNGRTSAEIAERVLALAELADGPTTDSASRRHVGYYLVGPGRSLLEQELGSQRRFGASARTTIAVVYTVAVLAVTLVGIFLIYDAVAARSASSLAQFVLMLPLAVLTNHLAVVGVRELFYSFTPPRRLPALSRTRVDGEATLVVIPTLLRSRPEALALIEHLKAIYEGNSEKCLRYALLTDFPDSTEPGDSDAEVAALDEVAHQVDLLNDAFRDEVGDCFFVLHRSRSFNPADRKWLGWERKRGKLIQLIRVIRGELGSATFSRVVGKFDEGRERVRWEYLLVLDRDTFLPPGQAKELLRVAAHPLNRPVLNAKRTRVVDGYGIVQPLLLNWVPEMLPLVERTAFARTSAGWFRPLRSMTSQVSRRLGFRDFHFDLLGSAGWGGKGLVHIETFERTCTRFPDDIVLSHDRLEGMYLRVGLAGFAIEKYPSRYLTFCARLERWIRGDLQNLMWTLPWAPADNWRWSTNSLSWEMRARLLRLALLTVMPVAVAATFAAAILLPRLEWPLLSIALTMIFYPIAVDAIRIARTRFTSGPQLTLSDSVKVLGNQAVKLPRFRGRLSVGDVKPFPFC